MAVRAAIAAAAAAAVDQSWSLGVAVSHISAAAAKVGEKQW